VTPDVTGIDDGQMFVDLSHRQMWGLATKEFCSCKGRRQSESSEHAVVATISDWVGLERLLDARTASVYLRG